jgi:CDP-glucose 4,6-dehydratase
MGKWFGSLEGLAMTSDFWRGRRVFLTGHTGFKGAWLALWLQRMGAEVHGYALPPPTTPSLFELARVADGMVCTVGDIRDGAATKAALVDAEPEIVIHMAAKALVREAYDAPIETFETNVMGTANVLEAVRQAKTVRAVVSVTSDKCYDNKEWIWGYRENDPMGGHDPYSASKGCAELVTASYRSSYFNQSDSAANTVALATARAGNVIGGGDWARDRLVPDALQSFANGSTLSIRNPSAIRPWQHVLEPLSGYLLLAQTLHSKGYEFAESWNFGPHEQDAQSVDFVVGRLAQLWGPGARWIKQPDAAKHEAGLLRLDCSKAQHRLGWQPRWNLEAALEHTVEWYKQFSNGAEMRNTTLKQIAQFEAQH